MAEWVNRLWNNIFVNLPPLPLLCEISGALHLVQPGLTAGRQAGRQNTGKFQRFFRVNPITRLIFKVRNFPEAIRFPTNPYY